MSEQDQTKMAKAGKKNRYRFNNRGNQATRTSYKSKIAKLEYEVFDVGAASGPAKFSKSLKSSENYIQMNYKTCDEIVKAIQQLKRPMRDYPKQPTRSKFADASGKVDQDEFEMAKFAWKEDYKGMKYQKDEYKDNELNAWALVYGQCLKGRADMTKPRQTTMW